jgi:hypothetical protein
MGVVASAVRTLIPADATKQARVAVYRALPQSKRRSILAKVVRKQAGVCESSGSPLYATLLEATAADVEAGGPCWSVLTGNERPGSVLALRFMGAVHRLVLSGDAPALAAYYPSVTSPARAGDPRAAFGETVAGNVPRLRELVTQPVQTNEVSRCAVLLVGFLTVARETGLPLRVLEIGASAGMNLLWDRYFYRAGERAWGDPASPVRLDDVYAGECPLLDVSAEVAERRGCDLFPLDVGSEQTVLALKSLIWADQVERFATFEGAVSLARESGAEVDTASAPDWLEAQLAAPRPGVATVVFQSYVQQFFSGITAARARRAFEDAGARASAEAPLAHLRFEPRTGGASLTLTTWPGGTERELARSTPHGRRIQLVEGAAPA